MIPMKVGGNSTSKTITQLYVLFDTGANSSNYIASYMVSYLNRYMDLYYIDIIDSVIFGDAVTRNNIHQAVVLKLKFKDPITLKEYERAHIFKILPIEKATPTAAPLIIGLPSICSHYLELMVNSLKHGHQLLKGGKSLEETLEEEISRLKAKPEIKIMKKKEIISSYNQTPTPTLSVALEDFINQNGVENELNQLLEVESKLNLIYNNKISDGVRNICKKISKNKDTSALFLSGQFQNDFETARVTKWEKLFSESKYGTISGSLQSVVDQERSDQHLENNSTNIVNFKDVQVGDLAFSIPVISNSWGEQLSDEEKWMLDYSSVKRIVMDKQSEGLKSWEAFLTNLGKIGEALSTWASKLTPISMEEMIEQEKLKDIEKKFAGNFDDIQYEKEIQAALWMSTETSFNREEYMNSTIPPWSHTLGESPEERDSYIPCSNTGLYNYLSTSYDEALAKYYIDAKKNTSPEAWDIVKDIYEMDLAKDRFVPKEWTGMLIEPISLKFTPDWKAVKAKGLGPRGSKAFVNQKMRGPYEKEFERMKSYMYRQSRSSTASRILVADKATPPYIRICGDYRPINKYVEIPQYLIPNIRNQIYRAAGAKYTLNIDLANGYHNLPICAASSQALALSTEWGLYEPIFMPEGVRSAPQEFQRVMQQVFAPMKDHTIVIWDNILVLCNTLEEVRSRFLEVLEICKKYNIILKMTKTQIGFKESEFFGYIVKENTIELSQSRKDGIKALKFFKTKKGAQSFLGSTNFFKDFVPNYSVYTSKLNDMVKSNFNWDPSTWTTNYEQTFEELKEQIMNAMVLHFPDYSKLWILRTDCSKDALGIVLFQVGNDGKYEPIAFHSQKLSEQAHNWAAVKLEAYAVYFGVRKLAYYLLGKSFVIEVDHANLVTMESSEQAIIQRWRSFLEGFDFRIKHIAGKQNLLADFQSRMFTIIANKSNDTILTNVYGHEDINDPLIQQYNHLCAQSSSHSFEDEPLATKHDRYFDFDYESSQPNYLVNAYIRGPISTEYFQCSSNSPLYTLFQQHDPSGLLYYMHHDQLIDGRDPISNLVSIASDIYIDAVSSVNNIQSPDDLNVDQLFVQHNVIDTSDTKMIIHPRVDEEGQTDHSNDLLNQFKDIIDDEFTEDFANEVITIQKQVEAEMSNLHGTRNLHYGADRMYKDSLIRFPGHRIPQSYFRDFVSKCAGCQKSRLKKDKLFLEQIRTLKADPRPRSAVCIDRVSISPPSKRGNTTAIIIADLFTRLVKSYPCSEYTSVTVANALKDYIITYGCYDVVQSDPGSDILGSAVEAINRRWKLGRKISLVNRHESNGNERLIQEILRHLRTLIADERAMDDWDDPDYIGFVNFCMNDQVNSETGLKPYLATFGDRDAAFFFLPEVDRYASKSSKAYVDKLNKSLELVRKLNAEYQSEIHKQRIAKTPAISTNQFRAGDLVWFRRRERIDSDGKLYFRNKGPFRVISVRRNDVQCEHIVTNKEKTFFISDVMPVQLDTPYEDLYEIAKRDSNEFDVVNIIGHKGNPTARLTVQFLILFEGEKNPLWVNFSADLMKNSKIQEYIETTPCLEVLKMTAEEAKKYIQSLKKVITEVKVGDLVYIDLRSFSLEDNGEWYESLGLPHPYEQKYVVEGKYAKAARFDKGKQIAIQYEVLKKKQDYNYPFIKWYGTDKTLTSDMILVDSAFIKKHPLIAPNRQVTIEEEELDQEIEQLQEKNLKKKFDKGNLIMKFRNVEYNIGNSTIVSEQYIYYGPLEVQLVTDNQLHCIHYVTGRNSIIPVKQAILCEDYNHNIIETQQLKGSLSDYPFKLDIKGYEGDPTDRSNISFMVKFIPTEEYEFMDYHFDLKKSQEFKRFIHSIPCLELLSQTQNNVKTYIKNIDNLIITDYKVNDIVYVNIRSLGKPLWYNKLQLPNHTAANYVMKGKIVKLSKNQKQVLIKLDFYSESYSFSSSMLKWYVMHEKPSITKGYIEIDNKMFQSYPRLKE